MKPQAFFHLGSGAVRFWVLIDGAAVGASIAKETLHYRYSPHSSNDDPLETYLAHVAELDEVVRRRVAGGSREPVMVRDHDMR